MQKDTGATHTEPLVDPKFSELGTFDGTTGNLPTSSKTNFARDLRRKAYFACLDPARPTQLASDATAWSCYCKFMTLLFQLKPSLYFTLYYCRTCGSLIRCHQRAKWIEKYIVASPMHPHQCERVLLPMEIFWGPIGGKDHGEQARLQNFQTLHAQLQVSCTSSACLNQLSGIPLHIPKLYLNIVDHKCLANDHFCPEEKAKQEEMEFVPSKIEEEASHSDSEDFSASDWLANQLFWCSQPIPNRQKIQEEIHLVQQCQQINRLLQGIWMCVSSPHANRTQPNELEGYRVYSSPTGAVSAVVRPDDTCHQINQKRFRLQLQDLGFSATDINWVQNNLLDFSSFRDPYYTMLALNLTKKWHLIPPSIKSWISPRSSPAPPIPTCKQHPLVRKKIPRASDELPQTTQAQAPNLTANPIPLDAPVTDQLEDIFPGLFKLASNLAEFEAFEADQNPPETQQPEHQDPSDVTTAPPPKPSESVLEATASPETNQPSEAGLAESVVQLPSTSAASSTKAETTITKASATSVVSVKYGPSRKKHVNKRIKNAKHQQQTLRDHFSGQSPVLRTSDGCSLDDEPSEEYRREFGSWYDDIMGYSTK